MTASRDVPVWADRCHWMHHDVKGLFDRRICKKRHRPGSRYCVEHELEAPALQSNPR